MGKSPSMKSHLSHHEAWMSSSISGAESPSTAAPAPQSDGRAGRLFQWLTALGCNATAAPLEAQPYHTAKTTSPSSTLSPMLQITSTKALDGSYSQAGEPSMLAKGFSAAHEKPSAHQQRRCLHRATFTCHCPSYVLWFIGEKTHQLRMQCAPDPRHSSHEVLNARCLLAGAHL